MTILIEDSHRTTNFKHFAEFETAVGAQGTCTLVGESENIAPVVLLRLG